MIKIEISENSPLAALAAVTAFGMLCMDNRAVFDAAGALLDQAKKDAPPPAPVPAPVSVAAPSMAAPVPPTSEVIPTAAPSTVPTAPISQSPAGSAAAASPSSTFPSNTAVPTSPAPAYTLEQISRAGAELIGRDPGLRDTLMGLLRQQGVQTVTQLDPSQYGVYATALRGLGARI